MHRPGGLAALIVGGFLVFTGVLPSVTTAAPRQAGDPGMPEAPLPGYTPRFVTQTDEASPWEDCLWASGAMLLDKWTRGDIRIDRERLRRASGDLTAGSTFVDFARAVSRLYGWRPHWSPGGGDPMTWQDLLGRLAEGGGAIVAGDYGRLGNPYVRWDRSYAANPDAAGHAMYVERYDAERDRLWLMDPLGRGGYSGEWVTASRLRNFVWKSGRLVHALATPALPAQSTAGYVPGPLTVAPDSLRVGERVTASFSFVEEGRRPLPELQLATEWVLVEPDAWTLPAAEPGEGAPADPTVVRATVPLAVPAPPPSDDLAVVEPVTVPAVKTLTLASNFELPTRPGLWRLATSVQRRDGRPVPGGWQQPPLEVRVWGYRGAAVSPVAPSTDVVAADDVSLTVVVENAGLHAWPFQSLAPRLGEEQATSSTELHVSWLRADGVVRPAMEPLTLTAASGEQLTFALAVSAPRLPGDYMLRFDVRDELGSLLAPEAPGAQLPIVVGAMPLPEQAPVQNQ